MVLELDPENKGISIQTEFPCYSIQFQDESNLKKTLEEITSKHGQIRGCIHLQNHDSTETDSEEQLFHSFMLAKHLKKHLVDTEDTARAFFVAVTQMDGFLGMGKEKPVPSTRGLAGLIKSLQKEWPQVLCRLVDFDPKNVVDDVSGKILQEILDPDLNLSETAYLGQERRTLETIPVAWNLSLINI